MNKKETFKIDRSALSVISLDEQDEEVMQYWKSKTPHERLVALETTRRMLYGEHSTSAGLQRVLEIVKQP